MPLNCEPMSSRVRSVPSVRRALVDSGAATRLHDAVARLARRFNVPAAQQRLSPAQESILGLIVTRGPIGLPDPVRIEGVHPTMVSRVVGELVDARLLRRFQDPGLPAERAG